MSRTGALHRTKSAWIGCAGEHQDEPGTKNIPGGQGTGLRNAAKFQMLIFMEDYLMAIHANLDGDRHQ